MKWITISSPLGALRLVADGTALAGVYFEDHHPAPIDLGAPSPTDPVLARAAEQLREWFAGARTRFELPLAPRGTEFQRAVWRALSAIPFGELRSYAEIATAIGRPGSARAVGAANARNPLSIVVPCHRVVGTGGGLTGYAGGLERKAWLLSHERRRAA
jgi:methylated-DNA-[protein]-cysteine S-methyltransferase